MENKENLEKLRNQVDKVNDLILKETDAPEEDLKSEILKMTNLESLVKGFSVVRMNVCFVVVPEAEALLELANRFGYWSEAVSMYNRILVRRRGDKHMAKLNNYVLGKLSELGAEKGGLKRYKFSVEENGIVSSRYVEAPSKEHVKLIMRNLSTAENTRVKGPIITLL